MIGRKYEAWGGSNSIRKSVICQHENIGGQCQEAALMRKNMEPETERQGEDHGLKIEPSLGEVCASNDSLRKMQH